MPLITGSTADVRRGFPMNYGSDVEANTLLSAKYSLCHSPLVPLVVFAYLGQKMRALFWSSLKFAAPI
jgi:hypothetical protein